MLLLATLLIVPLVPVVGNVHLAPAKRELQECNGQAAYCNRSYGNMTHIGAHDSYAFSIDPLALSRNQRVDVMTQLNNGIRILQVQSHMWLGALHLCHTSCALFDGGTLLDYLSKVKSFLDGHPHEVITLLFTNPEGVPVDTTWAPILNTSGIAQMAYVPPSIPLEQSNWPTLGTLIETGKRVVIFMDYNSDTSKVDYILPEFEMIWETPFDMTDPSFPCTVDRISGPLPPESHMSLLNHYLDVSLFGIEIPDEYQSAITNGVSSMLAAAQACASLNGGRNPNFILLDWVDIGDISTVIKRLNNVGGAMSSKGSGHGLIIAGYAWCFLMAWFYLINDMRIETRL